MLVSFSVGNFLSFKTSQKLSLESESFKEMPDNQMVPFLFSSEYHLLKGIAIYGHNSYGKSNFIKSFHFIQRLIFNSFPNGQLKTEIDVKPFRLNTEMLDRPSEFEIIFIVRKTKYRYLVKLTGKEIVFEGLYYADAKIRENMLFERDFQKFKISKTWNKDATNIPEFFKAFAKSHILFLSVLLSQELMPRIDEIRKWLLSNIIIPDNYMETIEIAKAIYTDIQYRDLILKFIENADIGFKTIFDKVDSTVSKSGLEKGVLNMWFDKEIRNFKLFTNHSVYNSAYEPVGNDEFELQKDESAGTVKYFIISCFLAKAIRNRQIVWIDELDARFDSLLLELLVKLFHDPNINPANAQVIFTTHNTILLDNKLRRDQMFCVTKNKYGESKISRMHSSENPIRIGRSIEKEYRKGKLGGVSEKLRRDLGPTLFDDLD